MKLADINRQLCEVYGEHAMSDSMVRRWVRHFNEGRENVHDDPRSGRPSVAHIISNKEKFKQTISTRQIICTVFWDRKGVLLVEFLPQGSAINAGVYCDTL
jgi:transposase